MELIDRDGLMKATGLSARKTDFILYLLKGPVLTKVYNQLDAKEGIDMIEEALNYFGMELNFDVAALDAAIPKEGPFITVSNHPFGFLDGIILLLIIGRRRPEFRAVANFLLSYFAPISDLFITVNPFENTGPKGMGGMKKSLEQLNKGLGLGLFPAGEVSTWYPGQKGVADRPWSLSSMRLIKQANVPVIPIFFAGQNSTSFHVMGKINPMLRTIRIPAEFLKKQKTTLNIGVGARMDVAELVQFSSEEALRDELRSRTYALADQFK
ncbi:MAG: 1-acyl-sn-glycerol-3-phosphate acyltransferase [Thalassolituus oleivorans]|jgi:putative hemolysin|uniref:Hemolysin n=1 Tax=hydrothermal vent metagenome TaxID=652676 RepID=A0A170PLL2_9ZZZZ|nr:1-acyl-sn-glycerol-3-phosphate acyltransferase [Thalassolituus oleivorans]MBQ0726180.1 1-acyl-sn-glycerol-3-phosphate acyltransferase [Thalassolituus oleivorans]MBQ0780728.1 1-acyl-sn-glycerol-3-phosphate acyltransferase [Thalassolituus oleivorans]